MNAGAVPRMEQVLKRLLLHEGGEVRSQGCRPPDNGILQSFGMGGKIKDGSQTGLDSSADSWCFLTTGEKIHSWQACWDQEESCR